MSSTEKIRSGLVELETIKEEKNIEEIKLEEPEPKTDNYFIKEIIDYYRKKITNHIQPHEEKSLQELYYWLKQRNIDSFTYLHDAIEVFSRKDSDKKTTFGYLVNIVRNWAIYGYGYMPTREDQMAIDLFEELTKTRLSVNAKNKFITLISRYGLSKIIYLLGRESEHINIQDDISLLYVSQFEKILDTKYKI